MILGQNRSSVQNAFYKKCPDGGARGGPCDKSAGWRLRFGTQGVCVQSLAWIGATVAEIRVGPKV